MQGARGKQSIDRGTNTMGETNHLLMELEAHFVR